MTNSHCNAGDLCGLCSVTSRTGGKKMSGKHWNGKEWTDHLTFQPHEVVIIVIIVLAVVSGLGWL